MHQQFTFFFHHSLPRIIVIKLQSHHLIMLSCYISVGLCFRSALEVWIWIFFNSFGIRNHNSLWKMNTDLWALFTSNLFWFYWAANCSFTSVHMRASQPYWLDNWNITTETHAQQTLVFICSPFFYSAADDTRLLINRFVASNVSRLRFSPSHMRPCI